VCASEAGVAQHAMMEASATEAAAVPLAPLDELLEKGTLRREDEPTAAPEPKKPRTSIGLADADSPERSEKLLASLAEYLETCGGSAEMITGWYTKTEFRKNGATAGTYDSYFFNTQVSGSAAPSGARRRRERTALARTALQAQIKPHAPPHPAPTCAGHALPLSRRGRALFQPGSRSRFDAAAADASACAAARHREDRRSHAHLVK
jgi:hypothetical protein